MLWNDPNAQGNRINPPDAGRVERSTAALERAPTLLKQTAFHRELFDFIRNYELQAQVDTFARGELWTLRFDFMRMERWVQIRLLEASWFLGIELELTSLAIWNGQSQNDINASTGIWSTRGTRRWIGMTTLTPVTVFAEGLELVIKDARSYTSNDLDHEPIDKSSRPEGRPRPL